MFEPAVFSIRIDAALSESWSDYFGAQSLSVEVDEAGQSMTTLISEPVDQAALVGMINMLNSLGVPLVSVECVPTALEGQPSEQDDSQVPLPSDQGMSVEANAKKKGSLT